MIVCIFTLDYEIYGNGEGSLSELVYEPAEKLKTVFKNRNARFVAFIEAAELEVIEIRGADSAISMVKHQIREFYNDGFEVGLHLHPQWYNAKFEGRKWFLDYREYNLCNLPRKRIAEIVRRSVDYLRGVLNESDFTPVAFRAGNWLLQPTEIVVRVLAENGIRIDSSVFKGGLQRNLGLDYRPALKNGYCWKFQDDVNVNDPNGSLIELPTYTVMVPTWKLLTRKRLGMHQKGYKNPKSNGKKLNRYLDFLRLWYPLKLDFCRMTMKELTFMMDRVILEDEESPSVFRPIVAIGHTKDLTDLETVDAFMSYLGEKGIVITTFQEMYQKYKC